MHPILFKLGLLTVHTYGLMYVLGILAAIALSEYRYQREGGQPGIITDLAFPVILGVLIGARTLFVIVEHEYFLHNPLEIFMIWKGGLVFYGGLIGGALAFFMIARIRKLELWHLADTVAPGIALGHAIGRWGCFFAGSCYGRPTNVPWAVTYSDPNSLARDIIGIPVHPTQLYSSAFLLLLCGLLMFIGSRSSFRGQVIASYGILYGVFRFFIEFLRGDPRGTVIVAGFTLSTSQAVSLVLVPFSIGVYLYLKKRGTKNDAGEVLFQDDLGHSVRAGY